MNVEIFWGRTVSQDQPLTFKTDTGTLIINQAALDGPSEGITTLSVESNYFHYDGEDENEDQDSSVHCKTETLAVCHLAWGRRECTPLKLFFGPLETVVFSVKGKGVIHITGRYRNEDEDEEDLSFDEDEDEYLNMSDESDLENSTNDREVEMEDMSSDDEEEEPKKPAALPPPKKGGNANGHKKNDKMRTSNDNNQYQNTKKPKKFEQNKNQSDDQRRNDNKNKKFHGGKPNKFNKH
ncbi:uncharacterized protein LOC126326206 [Schistocerca gregaria]|uniref:uncharacterized protein LOC126326206 n=1 Tax=Schistocerca gregaria TaxID=7010 RepID=UPI00211E10CF|nr:uncharacterized protein LOC126326206 [Schistocerca gregaria]